MSTIRKAGSHTVKPDSDEAKRIERTHGFAQGKAEKAKEPAAKGSTKSKEGER